MLTFINIGTTEMFIICISLLILFVAFVRCILNKNLTSTEKAVWLLVILIAPFLGAIAYFFVNENRKKKIETL